MWFCVKQRKKTKQWGREITQRVRALAVKHNDLGSTPRILMIEELTFKSCTQTHTHRRGRETREGKRERNREREKVSKGFGELLGGPWSQAPGLRLELSYRRELSYSTGEALEADLNGWKGTEVGGSREQ